MALTAPGVHVVVTNAGTGYTSNPYVTFGGGGSGGYSNAQQNIMNSMNNAQQSIKTPNMHHPHMEHNCRISFEPTEGKSKFIQTLSGDIDFYKFIDNLFISATIERMNKTIDMEISMPQNTEMYNFIKSLVQNPIDLQHVRQVNHANELDREVFKECKCTSFKEKFSMETANIVKIQMSFTYQENTPSNKV